jgi:hypothetical protein
MYFLADKVASHRKDPELLNKYLLDELTSVGSIQQKQNKFGLL